MEIRFRNHLNIEKTIDLKEESITSLQADKKEFILKNIVDDYGAMYINNNQTYFISNRVDEELALLKIDKSNIIFNEIFNILELTDGFFDKEIDVLSNTEKIYLNLLRNTNKESNIIIFDNLFNFLDYSNRKKIKKIIELLKDKKYIVIITSSDVDDLYKMADYSIIWFKGMFEYGNTDDIYNDVSSLIKNRIKVPTLPLITYKAFTEKKVKLFYSKDVRDIIKDIYKHV